MTKLTPKRIVEALPSIFQPSEAVGLNCIIQLHITGDDGGDWQIVIQDGTCKIVAGTAVKPTSILTTSDKYYVQLAEGDLSPMMAVMTRKAKVGGDPVPLMKMEKLFNRPRKGTY